MAEETPHPKSSETESVTKIFENSTMVTEISEKIHVENEDFEDFDSPIDAAYSSDDDYLPQITKTQGKN